MVIHELRAKYLVQELCEYLGCSRSGYYKWVTRQAIVTPKDLDDRRVCGLIRQVYEKRRIYGYRRVAVVLRRQTGEQLNRKRIQRLMRLMGLRSVVRRKHYPSFQATGYTGAVANRVARAFSASSPGQKLVTDITYFFVGQKRYYLSAVLDLYNRQIVAHAHGRHPDMSLVLGTLNRLATAAGSLKGAILHSDQGGQYTATAYRKALEKMEIVPSMSRKATPLDNAVMESFFGHLKCEAIYTMCPGTIEELATAIDTYIEFYNNERPHSTLNGKAPVELLNERLVS